MVFRKFISLALVLVLLPALLGAQQPASPTTVALQPATAAAKAAAGPKALKILPIQGEGAKNNTRARTATQPAVEIRDENDKPVAGAEVVFRLPATGPGGTFHDWMRAQTARTNAQGQAVASGFTPNEEEGRFNIKVTAAMAGVASEAVIAQSNVRGPMAPQVKSGRSAWWKPVLIAVAAGGLVGGIYAARGGSSGAAAIPATPVTITPGPITVGTPR